jgi:hypothetical protein
VAFLLNIIDDVKTFPKYIIYDDACHLSKYVINKAKFKFNNLTERGKLLSESIIVCDRFHFIKHVDNWCNEHCDPDKHEGLKGMN